MRTLSTGATCRLLRGTRTVSDGAGVVVVIEDESVRMLEESVRMFDMLEESVVVLAAGAGVVVVVVVVVLAAALSVCWLCVGVGAAAPVPSCVEDESVVVVVVVVEDGAV
jgi:hypothetical protein